jgi:hypothetical protein
MKKISLQHNEDFMQEGDSYSQFWISPEYHQVEAFTQQVRGYEHFAGIIGKMFNTWTKFFAEPPEVNTLTFDNLIQIRQ